MQRAILDPAGLTSTAHFPAGELAERCATGYGPRRHEDDVRASDPYDSGRLLADGGLWSTVEDLARWLTVHSRISDDDRRGDGDRVLDGPTLREMQHPAAFSDWSYAQGLGWATRRIGEDAWVGHTGSLNGFRAIALFRPKDRLGVIALTNGSVRPDFAMEIATLVLEAHRAVPPTVPAAPPAPTPEAWRELVGTYEEDDYGSGFRIEVRDGALVIIDTDDPSEPAGARRHRGSARLPVHRGRVDRRAGPVPAQRGRRDRRGQRRRRPAPEAGTDRALISAVGRRRPTYRPALQRELAARHRVARLDPLAPLGVHDVHGDAEQHDQGGNADRPHGQGRLEHDGNERDQDGGHQQAHLGKDPEERRIGRLGIRLLVSHRDPLAAVPDTPPPRTNLGDHLERDDDRGESEHPRPDLLEDEDRHERRDREDGDDRHHDDRDDQPDAIPRPADHRQVLPARAEEQGDDAGADQRHHDDDQDDPADDDPDVRGAA